MRVDLNSKLFSLFDSLENKFDGILMFDSVLLKYYVCVNGIEGAFLILKEETFLFVDFRYFETAKLCVNEKKISVVLYKNFKKELFQIFNNFNVTKVAVVSEGVSARTFMNLNSYFEKVKFFLNDELDYFIKKQMAIKKDFEIENIICAQKISQNVLHDVLNFIRPGVSEISVAREINSLICKRADGLAFETIVVSGERTSLPHGTATDRLLKKGDFITLDFGAVVDGYRSDMTRTFCLGSPSQFQKEIYEIVLRAQQLALKKIKVGVKCSSIDLLVRNFFAEYGYSENFGHSLGHGVGVKIHELPNVSLKSLETFEKNMVCTVEPGLYFKNILGVRIEDMVLIKEDGIENITNFDKNLICL